MTASPGFMKAQQLSLAAALLCALCACINGSSEDTNMVHGTSQAGARLPVEGRMPALGRATAWLNSQPLGAAELRGKVVLVDFWTYTCSNWRRTLPWLAAWHQKYASHGLVIVGVHTPEFSFERDVDNLSAAGEGAEAAADWQNLATPETYVGSAQASGLVSLVGDWTTRRESAVLNRAGGKIVYRFRARDAHFVMGPAARGAAIRFRVSINGRPPGASRGTDVDAAGNGTLDQPRMYQLIRQSGPIGERQFGIEFLDPGAEAFVFTFG